MIHNNNSNSINNINNNDNTSSIHTVTSFLDKSASASALPFHELKKIDQPVDLNINLFPHQLVSVYDMEYWNNQNVLK